MIRTCALNVAFHRRRAKSASKRAKTIDIIAALLAAIAGVGILSEFKGVPDTLWAVLAFFSGLVGQLRSVFGLSDMELEHRKLQNDYSSVLSTLNSLIDRAKEAGGLTQELDTQRQLILERFHFVAERDETDYKPEEIDPLQQEVNEAYPPDSLWMPPGTS